MAEVEEEACEAVAVATQVDVEASLPEEGTGAGTEGTVAAGLPHTSI